MLFFCGSYAGIFFLMQRRTDDVVYAIFAMFAYVVVISLAACGFFAIFRQHYLMRPIRRVCEAAQKVASGDFAVRLTPMRKDGRVVVIHCASIVTLNPAPNPKVYDVNVNGTKNIIDFSYGPMAKFILDYAKGKMKAGIDGIFNSVDVRDLASGVISCCQKGRRGECYTMSNEMVTMEEMFRFSCRPFSETIRDEVKWLIEIGKMQQVSA